MKTRYSTFLHPSSFNRSSLYSQHGRRRCGSILSLYSIIAAIIFLLALLSSSPQAFAATTQSQFHNKASLPLSWNCGDPNNGHCYGIHFWGGANGADTRISLNTSLNGGSTYNDLASYSFVTTEMWLQTAATGANNSNAYWVEAGIISEYAYTSSAFPFYFWADKRPNGGGFAFHYLSNIAYSGNALVRITRSGSSNWNVLIQDSNGSLTGVSTANNFSVANIVVGTELHNDYQTAHEPNIYYTNNRWENNSGQFVYQGNDGTGANVISPVRADWYNGQDPPHSSTGGVWYSCILGYGC